MSSRAEVVGPHGGPSAIATATIVVARTLGRIVRRAVFDVSRRRHLRKTVTELSELDDHLLHDIGLARDDIPRAARDMFDVRGALDPNWRR